MDQTAASAEQTLSRVYEEGFWWRVDLLGSILRWRDSGAHGREGARGYKGSGKVIEPWRYRRAIEGRWCEFPFDVVD